ncbi:MAG TPA: hypothetical protein VFU14_11790 [Acidimicrobiales bacterium]|nr:hypothetical protein [Acidimicrobiales bacterium]
MLRRTVVTLVASALLLAACGDDGGEDDEARARYVDAMAESMAADDVPFAPEDRECLSGKFVDAMGGASALEDAGVTPAEIADGEDLAALDLDLGEDDAEAIAASFRECDVSLADMLLADAGDQVTPEMRACVEENLDEEVLADFFAQVLVDDEASTEPPEALLEPLMACF